MSWIFTVRLRCRHWMGRTFVSHDDSATTFTQTDTQILFNLIISFRWINECNLSFNSQTLNFENRNPLCRWLHKTKRDKSNNITPKLCVAKLTGLKIGEEHGDLVVKVTPDLKLYFSVCFEIHFEMGFELSTKFAQCNHHAMVFIFVRLHSNPTILVADCVDWSLVFAKAKSWTGCKIVK